MLLALLIHGKQSVISEVSDVYMEPLVDELLELWIGIATYDVTKIIGFHAFMLHVVLRWTIYDFLRYGTLGGFAHQGYADCLWCGPELGVE